MKTLIRNTSFAMKVYLLLAVGLLAFIAGLLYVATARADSAQQGGQAKGRLVTIHDRGNERVILTSATTVADALADAGLTLATNDAVEPSVETTLVANDYTVNVYRARTVMVVDGMVRQKVLSPYQTPEQIARSAGVALQDEDETTIRPMMDVIGEGAGVEMVIDRATEFSLVLYGEKTTAYSQAATVGAMLDAKKIVLGANDTLSISRDTNLTAGMVVEIWRDGTQTITEEQEIAFATEKIKDADREVSYREVKTPGVPGKKSVTYEVEMKNGKEVARKEIQSVVLTEPKKQVEIVGAKPSFSGGFADALAKLRACESGGDYANKKNPLYRGAYQFGYTTWGNKYGIKDPADATPAQQDQAARELYERRGWQPWPHCGANLPDTYR